MDRETRAEPARYGALFQEETYYRDSALARGLVWRAPDFWASFHNASFFRQIFDGNGAYGLVSSFYGELEIPPDNPRLHNAVIAWAQAYDQDCSSHFTTRDRLLGPFYGLVSEGEEVDVDDPDSFQVTLAFAPAMEAWLAFEKSPENRLREIQYGMQVFVDMYKAPGLSGFPGAVDRIVEEKFGLRWDMTKFLSLAGCDTPTARQFMLNLRQAAVDGPSLQEAGVTIRGFEEASDPAPVNGQHNSVAEVCWAVSGWGWQVPVSCLCADDVDRGQEGDDGEQPIDFNARYQEVVAGGRCAAFSE